MKDASCSGTCLLTYQVRILFAFAVDLPDLDAVWRTLIGLVDSESRNPIRVFVERAPGVRENEPIMRFHSS